MRRDVAGARRDPRRHREPRRALAARRAHRRLGPGVRAERPDARRRRPRARPHRRRVRGPPAAAAPPGGVDAQDGRWVFAVESRPGREVVRARHVVDDAELEDLAPPYDGPAEGWAVVDEPLFLVCTHGRHDRCCALRGRPVAAALAARHPAHHLGVQPRRRGPVRGQPARAARRALLRPGRGRRGARAGRRPRGRRARGRPAARAQQPVAARAGRAALRPGPAGPAAPRRPGGARPGGRRAGPLAGRSWPAPTGGRRSRSSCATTAAATAACTC